MHELRSAEPLKSRRDARRQTRFARTAFDGRVPEGGEPGEAKRVFAAEVNDQVAAIRLHHEAREFRRAAAETRWLWARANAYVQETAPWSAMKADRVRAALATRVALALVEVGATVAWSIVPDLAVNVLRATGVPAGSSIPAWPHDLEGLILGEARSGSPPSQPFEPVAKFGAGHLDFALNGAGRIAGRPRRRERSVQEKGSVDASSRDVARRRH